MFNLEDNIKFDEKENDVLAIGELLIDMISADYGDDFEGNTYHKYFGGSPANIAINTRKLGINSMVASAVGKDGLGSFLKKHLQDVDIDTSYIQTVDHATSMVLVTKSKHTPIPIFYRDADYQLEYSDQLSEAIKKSKIYHFSCWPISRNPSRQTIEKGMDVAKENNLLICFDPNYHPKLWQQGEDGVAYVKSIISKVDIVKPSEDDAERIFGRDTAQNHIKKFQDLGAKLVIMTLGEDGAIVSNGRESLRFPTYATNVVDATGAGDAFWSGFYAALVKGYSIKDSLKLGFGVSAYKLQYTGAVVDLPKLEKIKENYNL